jgi:hypothetical protein
MIERGAESQVGGDVLVLVRGEQARSQNDVGLGVNDLGDCFVGRSNDDELVVQRLLDESPENYTSFRVWFDSKYLRHDFPRENNSRNSWADFRSHEPTTQRGLKQEVCPGAD